VIELSATMPIGPFDLGPHFERDGLFEYGLDRFERTVAKRVQERGAFSAVLERLALMKAPAVFMLEDVAGSADVSREQALRVLERLADAPWHLVSRVDSGEFCVRYRVHDALWTRSAPTPRRCARGSPNASVTGCAAYPTTSIRSRVPRSPSESGIMATDAPHAPCADAGACRHLHSGRR
jgi:hypothetical protein